VDANLVEIEDREEDRQPAEDGSSDQAAVTATRESSPPFPSRHVDLLPVAAKLASLSFSRWSPGAQSVRTARPFADLGLR